VKITIPNTYYYCCC